MTEEDLFVSYKQPFAIQDTKTTEEGTFVFQQSMLVTQDTKTMAEATKTVLI